MLSPFLYALCDNDIYLPMASSDRLRALFDNFLRGFKSKLIGLWFFGGSFFFW